MPHYYYNITIVLTPLASLLHLKQFTSSPHAVRSDLHVRRASLRRYREVPGRLH